MPKDLLLVSRIATNPVFVVQTKNLAIFEGKKLFW